MLGKQIPSTWHWHFEEVSVLESGMERYLAAALVKSSSSLLVCFFLSFPRPLQKARNVSAFFTGALLRFMDGLHSLQAWHSNLRHKDKSRSEFFFFSRSSRCPATHIPNVWFASRISLSLSLSRSVSFFLYFIFCFSSFSELEFPAFHRWNVKSFVKISGRRLANRFVGPLQFFLWIRNFRLANWE